MKKLTKKEWIEKAKKVHGDKYDYSLVDYINNKVKVCIICPIHGEFWMRPTHHIDGSGCPKCRNEYMHNLKVYSFEEIVNKSKQVHNGKYQLLNNGKYINSKSIIDIICPVHGIFSQEVASHLHGHGCSKCASEQRGKNLRDTKEEFIKKAKQVHGNKYNYSKVEYVNNHIKVCIICLEHGEFWQTPNNHLNGKGCPMCNISKLELDTELFLSDNGIKYIKQCSNKVLPFIKLFKIDFYLPDYKIAIECQGLQHFKPIEYFGGIEAYNYIHKNDLEKKFICESNGIKMVYVNYNDNVNEVLTKNIC